MAIIKLKIQPDTTQIKPAVEYIQKQFESIGNIKIKIDTGSAQGVQGVVKTAKQAADAMQRAEQSVVSLRKEYANLITSLDSRALKTPGIGFDELSKKAQEFQNKLLALDGSSESFLDDVRDLQKSLKDLQARYAELNQMASPMDKAAKDAQAAAKESAQAEKEQQKVFDTIMKNRRQREAEEEESRRRGIASVDAWVQEYNASMQRAEQSVVSLDRQYANLSRSIDTLKAQYPAGTFDEIEREVREARDAIQNLDNTSTSYTEDVGELNRRLQQLKTRLANVRADTDKVNKVTESLWMNIQKFARWYLIGNVFHKILRELKEALQTMKDVDKELANIQKVTGRTNEEMQKLAASAYSVASAYGVQASEYLESVADFAKAGYGDQAEYLAEVATKTQLVGDTTAETANKFLIAADAAWQMGGNISSLNHLLDAANEIENNYATTIDKLAQGFPIVASVAAQAGMTVEETMAALGTITSVTQETGTKAATALRALILNIIGAVGEYEDGIEVTEESVKSLDGLLQIYAKDALKAAKAAGTVINPMEAIAALAKASEEGLLNQAELFEVLSSLGGKLRTNQLTAITTHFDTFNEMLGKTAQSAGSADKEISIMLDTWEAKTNILKNTWTEFISNLVDTDMIKTALDGVIKLLKALNTEVGRVAAVSTSLAAVLTKMLGGGGWLFAGVAAAMAAILGIYEAIRSVQHAAEDWADAAKEAYEHYDDLNRQITDLKSKSEELTEAEKNRLKILELEADNAEREAKAKAQSAYWAAYGGATINLPFSASVQRTTGGSTEEGKVYRSFLGMSIVGTGGDMNPDKSKSSALALIRAYQEAQRTIANPSSLEELNKAEEELAQVSTEIAKMADHLQGLSEILGDELPQDGKDALEILLAFIDGLQSANDKTEKTPKAAEPAQRSVKSLTETMKDASEAADNMDEAIGGVIDALEKYGKSSVQVYDAMVKLEKTIPGSTDKLYDFETATLKVDAGLIADKASLLDFISSSKTLDLTNQIKQLEDAAKASWNFAIAIAASVPGADPETLARQMTDPVYGYIGTLKAQLNEFNSFYDTLRERSGYTVSSSKSNSSATAQEDEILAARKQRMEYLKAELAFLQASGASTDKIVAKEKEIQSALHDVAERMREISGETADTVGLSTEWWNIQKDILAVQQEMFDTLKGIIDEYYDAAVTDKEKELTLEEKILAVQKAQVALENAQKERTVRYYNAASGQWERTANRQNVKSAQDALKSAQDDLNAYQKEQAWTEFKTAWEYVTEQIKAGAMTFADAYDYMYKAMKGIQDKYDYDMGLVLEDSIGSWNGLNKTIKDFDAETGKVLTDSVGKLKAQMDSFTTAIDAFKEAFDTVKAQIEAGSLSFGDAYKVLYDRAIQIDGIYGTNMANALNAAVAGMDRTTGSIDELWKQVVITLMRTNSVNWHGADAATQAYLHAQNVALAKTIGAEYDPSGYWYLGGQRMYDPTSDGGAGTSTVQDSGPAPAASYTPAANQGNTAPGTVYVSGIAVPVTNGKVSSDWNEGTVFTDPSGNKWRVSADGTLTPYSLPTYDSGGVLRGLGGIKATAGDELVLPPDVTRKMLDPVNNEYSMRAIDDLRWMFGLRDRPRSVSEARNVTNNSGATYNFGGITLTEEQAKRTTVYDFAQLARGLGAYNGRI